MEREEPMRMELPLPAEQIQKILPHRYPMLLVDRVEELVPGVLARAKKCVSINEPFFQGHFPGMPVMPGVLILEALAQTGAVALLSEPESRGKIALFGGVRNARFKRQVVPGDVLELFCRIDSRKGPVGMGTCEARVDGALACRAELLFALTDGPQESQDPASAMGPADFSGDCR